MKLTQPELRRVWPGARTLDKPEGEVRLLHDELICYDDVKDAITTRRIGAAAAPRAP